nr:hypothetical protein [Sediminibacterium sp.]
MTTKYSFYLILILLSVCIGKNATAKNWIETENYINRLRILSSKGIVLDAPMVKDKETRKRYNNSLQEGWGFPASAAKRV